MFDTYGPFNQPTCDDSGIETFFEAVRSDPTPNLEHGKGVYIFAAPDDKGMLMPWYVGRTYSSFGARLFRHYTSKKFATLLENASLSVFLLALAIDGRVITRPTSSAEKAAIRYLEILLIGTALRLNANLLNKQQTRFHRELHVAGYIDAGPSDRNFPAAQALADLLRT